MPRGPREKSSSGIYHIMLRGINRQSIFEDDDRYRFLVTLKSFEECSKYNFYGYCLMDNHVHILIQEVDEDIFIAMKRICSSYVYWYNKKYERCGHLFQERFKSETVETDNYFLTVLRYIHQNPVKAGLAKTLEGNKWTSYREYIDKPTIINVDFGLNLFSLERGKAIEQFVKYMNKINTDKCLDYEDGIKLNDSEVRKHIIKLGIENISALQHLEKENRNNVLRQIKYIEGVTVRQLSRITGISKSVFGRL